jgi:hypothetical protein
VTDPQLGPLDFVYAPSADVAVDARWLVETIGAELVFAIDRSGTRVAMLRVGTGGPAILLTDHLPDDRPVFIYRVDDLAATSADFATRGWTPERTLELPMGTCTELSRPGVVESMAGQRDF